MLIGHNVGNCIRLGLSQIVFKAEKTKVAHEVGRDFPLTALVSIEGDE